MHGCQWQYGPRGVYGNIPDSLYEDLHLDKDTVEVSVDNIVESADDLSEIAEKMRG